MVSQLILRVHAVFLAVLTLSLTALSFAGLHRGAGPYAFLQQDPAALIGLVQAYLLMGLIGVALWRGSRSADTRGWSVLAIVAHCVPLLTVGLAWDVIQSTAIADKLTVSYLIHGGWIAVELASATILYRVPLRSRVT